MHLSVVHNVKKDYKPDLDMLCNALAKVMFKENGFLSFSTIKEYAEEQRDEFKKLLFLMVRATNKSFRKQRDITFEVAENDFLLVSHILEMFEHVTPNELLQMFPVAKQYDGQKYEMKDYFYTMNSLNKLDRDSCIGNHEKVINLFWDYQNEDINRFMACWMKAVSHVRQFQGGMDPLEELLMNHGVPTYTFHEKEGYMYNRMTGEVTPVRKKTKRIPKYMKVIKETKEKE